MSRRLVTEPHNLTGFNGVDRPPQGWHQRHEILEAITARDKDDDRDLELLEVLLKRKVPINRHEHVVLAHRKREQFAILLAGPAGLRNGMDLMPRQ